MSKSLESTQQSNLVSSLDVNQQSLVEAQVWSSNVSFPISTAATQESYGVNNPTMSTLELSDSEPITRGEFRSSLKRIEDTLSALTLAILGMSTRQPSTSDAQASDTQQARLEELVQEHLLEQRTADQGVVAQVFSIQEQFVELQCCSTFRLQGLWPIYTATWLSLRIWLRVLYGFYFFLLGGGGS